MKDAIYTYGIDVVKRFLDVNAIQHPLFFRYSEADKMPARARRFLEKVQDGPLVGTRTGLYCYDCIFVNVPVTALPVQNPGNQRWSYPCWKTDRTAIGVLAHECGHYVEDYLQHVKKTLLPSIHGHNWRVLVSKGKKVTSYEPVPSEAWAETMRVFILNPDLLRLGIPKRYKFLIDAGLKPSETRPWNEVLNHPAYIAAGERWIDK